MAQATQRSTETALNPAGSLFAELLRNDVALDGDQELDTDILTMPPPSRWTGITDGDLEAHADITFEPLFKAIDESFDLFALELDLCMSPSTPDAHVPEFSNLGVQAASSATLWTLTDKCLDDTKDPQPLLSKRKRSSKSSSQ